MEKVDEEETKIVDVMVRTILDDMVETLPIQVNGNDLCKFCESHVKEAKSRNTIVEQHMECSCSNHSLFNGAIRIARDWDDDEVSRSFIATHENDSLVTMKSPQIIKEKSTLTVILSLSGLLLKRCWQKLPKHKSLKIDTDYVVLRSGCIMVLCTLLDLYNVGNWSTSSDNNVVDIINALGIETNASLSFFMIWGQDGCRTCKKQRICRLDNPSAEAFFKPLAVASKAFLFDVPRSILIEYTPYKSCVNPSKNCIFPPSFDVSRDDDTLLGKLLPYLKNLDLAIDVCDAIKSSMYGKDPISKGHEWYNLVEVVMEEWKDENSHWARMQYNTGKLPQHIKDLCRADASSSSRAYSTQSQSKSTKDSLDHT